MRMVNISNEKSMQSYTARCSRYKNKYTNLVCGKTAVGRNYNLPRDNGSHREKAIFCSFYIMDVVATPTEQTRNGNVPASVDVHSSVDWDVCLDTYDTACF